MLRRTFRLSCLHVITEPVFACMMEEESWSEDREQKIFYSAVSRKLGNVCITVSLTDSAPDVEDDQDEDLGPGAEKESYQQLRQRS